MRLDFKRISVLFPTLSLLIPFHPLWFLHSLYTSVQTIWLTCCGYFLTYLYATFLRKRLLKCFSHLFIIIIHRYCYCVYVSPVACRPPCVWPSEDLFRCGSGERTQVVCLEVLLFLALLPALDLPFLFILCILCLGQHYGNNGRQLVFVGWVEESWTFYHSIPWCSVNFQSSESRVYIHLTFLLRNFILSPFPLHVESQNLGNSRNNISII